GACSVRRAPPAGVTRQAAATAANRRFGITPAAGSLWFTGVANNVLTIRKMTTDGTLTEFPVATPNTFGSATSGIVAGPDGNIWFTESSANKIGRITPGGVITEFAAGAASRPRALFVGPAAALWFTEPNASKARRMTADASP